MRLEPLDPLSSFLFIEGGSICIENLLKLEGRKKEKRESLNLRIMERRRNLLKINIYIV